MTMTRTAMATAIVVAAAFIAPLAYLAAVRQPVPGPPTLRLGYFPNITHAQALFGVATGLFQQYLGSDVRLETKTFNAGPMAIEALLAGQVDMTFVGPSPTISGLVAATDVLRVIAGGASGGALFVVQADLRLDAPADYSGKRFASPQAGNTQDIALKHHLSTLGHVTRDRGGDVDVINAANPDILALFQRRQIDGAWVPEPWATRLVREGNGRVLLDERSLWPGGQFVTTHLVTTATYLLGHQDLARRLLDALVEATLRLRGNQIAQAAVNRAIYNLTGSRLADATIAEAFAHLNLTFDPIRTSFETYFQWSKDLGFVGGGFTDSSLYDLRLLNAVLEARGLPPVG